MASIMTNTSAMVALQSLKATNKAMDVTQGRISTGYRVAEASDNAAYWSIATTMRSDNKALSAVQDALGLGAGKIDTAYTAMNDALGAVDSIKAKLVTARGASAENQAKIQEEIKILLDQIKSSATGASYAGTNILATDDTGTMEVVASYNRSATGTVTVGTISIDLASVKLFAAGGLPGGIADDVMLIDIVTNGTDADIDGYLTDIETALSDISNAAANLGAAKTRLDLQKDFVSNLMDSIERGVGQLVDADMNEESTRLQALQVQQQLGIQALSIANQNAQSILALFK
ncbi:flagellin N-terminal helical domain-containing protein [Nitratireductor indicus]|uniref:flagellin N-terminal helical domain-containing protein n=1 Tax=Nitratireductor indicus TaxID=721133 RepID=UPI002876E6C2|nr:flagellin [Nitratireductor indicus]MDS1136102.1 flagellin [Nitratireductor indicus]